MRIGLFSDTYPPEINGVANSTRILRDMLVKHGHEVFVITTGEKDTGWDDEHTILRFDGMTLKFLYGYVMTSPFHFSYMEDIKELDLELIHAQTEFGIGIFARICAKQLNIPLVSTYHTTYEDYTHYINPMHLKAMDSIAKMAIATLSKKYGNSSMRVISPSEKTKEMLLKYKVSSPIEIIPTGLQLDRFSPSLFKEEEAKQKRLSHGVQDDEKLLIYVGRIAEEKALDVVVDGFQKAYAEGAKVKLWIVGGGPDFHKLEKIVSNSEAQSAITLFGPVCSEEVPFLYHCADAFVSASLSETQGMTFIEALASGLPLFAREDDVLNDLLIEEKTGWFVKDANDLANHLLSFAQLSKEEMHAIEETCLLQAQPYSSEVFYEKMISVYEDVVKEFSHQYVIDDMKVKDNTAHLYLISPKKEEMRLQVALDDYYNSGLRKGQVIPEGQLNELKERENGVKAYQRCLRKIAAKDRTRKELYDWLTQNTECSIDTINRIIEKLEEKGFVNDERYCEDRINSMKKSLFGKDRIIKDLQKKGIPMEMIHAKMQYDEDENENALLYAQRIVDINRKDSTQKLKQNVRVKLIQRGFSNDVVNEVIKDLDFSKSINLEFENLRKCATKAKRRYGSKYEGSELRNRIYRYCLSQGYRSEDIYAIMDEMEWKYD